MILFENSLFIRLCLSVIYFTNIFQACSANHILTEINAINFENIIHKVNFDSIEIRSGNDSSRNLADEYNDSNCVKQFSDLRSSYNRSELWAMKGKTNYFGTRRESDEHEIRIFCLQLWMHGAKLHLVFCQEIPSQWATLISALL